MTTIYNKLQLGSRLHTAFVNAMISPTSCISEVLGDKNGAILTFTVDMGDNDPMKLRFLELNEVTIYCLSDDSLLTEWFINKFAPTNIPNKKKKKKKAFDWEGSLKGLSLLSKIDWEQEIGGEEMGYEDYTDYVEKWIEDNPRWTGQADQKELLPEEEFTPYSKWIDLEFVSNTSITEWANQVLYPWLEGKTEYLSERDMYSFVQGLNGWSADTLARMFDDIFPED